MKQAVGIAASVLFLAALAACSTTPNAPAASDAKAGPAVAVAGTLKTANGDMLYFYKKDTANASTCVRDCLKVFRPLFSTPDDKKAGDFSVIERTDGMSQWSYKGKPLYLCPIPTTGKAAKAADKKRADCAKGLQGDWEIAKP